MSTAMPTRSAGHIVRLDAIRLVAAAWVVLSHGLIPWKQLTDQPVLKFGFTAIGASFSGISAVMVFFIVSGLCIHLPNVDGRPLATVPFLVRRFVRVGFPLIVMLAIAQLFGAGSVAALADVTWSLYAELFYYALYPVLYVAARRWGWMPLIVAASLLSVIICITHRDQLQVSHLGWITWVWGLPVWLSGCRLAERLASSAPDRNRVLLWISRGTLWSASVAATYLLFHGPVKVSYLVSMLAISLIAYLWLSGELRLQKPAWALFERGGAASYSLYIVHPVILSVLPMNSGASPWVDGVARCLAVGAATALMYFAIEAPSHKMARRLADAVKGVRSRSFPVRIDI